MPLPPSGNEPVKRRSGGNDHHLGMQIEAEFERARGDDAAVLGDEPDAGTGFRRRRKDQRANERGNEWRAEHDAPPEQVRRLRSACLAAVRGVDQSESRFIMSKTKGRTVSSVFNELFAARMLPGSNRAVISNCLKTRACRRYWCAAHGVLARRRNAMSAAQQACGRRHWPSSGGAAQHLFDLVGREGHRAQPHAGASNTAFAIADGTTAADGSPTPQGFSAGRSMRSMSTSGTSGKVRIG